MKILQGITTVLTYIWTAFLAATTIMFPVALFIWCFQKIGGVL